MRTRERGWERGGRGPTEGEGGRGEGRLTRMTTERERSGGGEATRWGDAAGRRSAATGRRGEATRWEDASTRWGDASRHGLPGGGGVGKEKDARRRQGWRRKVQGMAGRRQRDERAVRRSAKTWRGTGRVAVGEGSKVGKDEVRERTKARLGAEEGAGERSKREKKREMKKKTRLEGSKQCDNRNEEGIGSHVACKECEETGRSGGRRRAEGRERGRRGKRAEGKGTCTLRTTAAKDRGGGPGRCWAPEGSEPERGLGGAANRREARGLKKGTRRGEGGGGAGPRAQLGGRVETLRQAGVGGKEAV